MLQVEMERQLRTFCDEAEGQACTGGGRLRLHASKRVQETDAVSAQPMAQTLVIANP